MTRLAAVALAGLLAGAPAALAQYGSPPPPRAEQGLPKVLERVGFDQRIGEQLPLDVVMRDESGRTVRLGEYFTDLPVLLVPAYYECPMLCTLVLNGVTSALKALPFSVGKEFRVVVFSFDPRDTPEKAAGKKRSYVGEYRRAGADADWHFLTGDEAQIRRLTEAIGFRYTWEEASQQYAHATGIVIATPHGRMAQYFYGVEFSPRDLRLALIESSKERIGTVVDQLLLFCFHYDPATGTYSKLALDAVRVGGVLTLAGLATFVLVMLRRDARRRRAAQPGGSAA